MKSLFSNTGAPKQWQIVLISTYSLSKGTDLYPSAAYSTNAGLTPDSAATGYLTSLALGFSYTLPSGANSMMGVAVGMRHKF
ncbi:hypothetical protein [Ralstonia sp. GX3-BWBA]|uniref:hypothetical protein n=1 Tax=Ralstonia sp. GX3-BWBA TaxID=2219865 RepID=UPI000DD4B415|nr:hypothetical protein [Ralstonia sp. GX3-BWBA]